MRGLIQFNRAIRTLKNRMFITAGLDFSNCFFCREQRLRVASAGALYRSYTRRDDASVHSISLLTDAFFEMVLKGYFLAALYASGRLM